MEAYRFRYLQIIGILLCFVLRPIWTTEPDDDNFDEFAALFEVQRYELFEWDLLRELGSPEFGNVVVSPLSIRMVLAMLYEGSSGATEKELEQVLHFPPNKQDTKKSFQRIVNSLKTGTVGQTLDMGSRVFLDSSVQPQQRFEAALKTFYDTDIKSVDFSNTSVTKDDINYWVSNVTHGYIQDLVTEGDLEGASLILANAIYYKGLWRHPFPREKSYYGTFYTAPNNPIQVPYMQTEYPFYFGNSIELDAKIIRLPFQSGNIVMFIILPNSKAGLNGLIRDLNPQVLRRQVYVMNNQKNVNVHLPRFAFEFNSKLGRILQTLGLHHIFQNTASLAGIARGKNTAKKLMVSNVLQKSGIEINEEGSTVFAASAVSLANKFGGPRENFNASHPFVFYIEDEFTGSVLFAGKIENPTQAAQPPFREDLNFPSRFGETDAAESTPLPSSSSSTPVASSANGQNQNFGNQNQNFGTTHFPFFPGYEENDLQAEQYFYFDIDLLKELAHEQREGNILVSPLSIKSVLAMLLEGAQNETANELRMALHLPNNQRVREQFRKLLAEFEQPKGGVTLKMANRIFVTKKLSVLKSFRDVVNQYYYANVTELDFSNPVQSANAINNWISEKTQGIIPKLVQEGTLGEVSILLANALYFKGTWEKAFDSLETKTNCFYLSNGECQMTPMMDIIDNFKYAEVNKLDAKVIELPYAGGEYSMVIVLPNQRNGIQQLSRDIRTSINNIVQNLNETEVFVTLPRFRIDYNVDLVNHLPKVHISDIFSPHASLNSIVADVSARVSNILHKTYIEVNEQGTVAAAATGAIVIPLMGVTKPRIKADHPFLFFIRHTATGTILFEGRLSIPERAYDQNQQRKPQQAQRPVQQNQNNFNQNFQNFQNTQPSFEATQKQQTSFQSPSPPNFQSQQRFPGPNFPRPLQQLAQTAEAFFHQQNIEHTAYTAEQNRHRQHMQSDKANVNDLKNSDQSKYDNESLVYEGEVNNRQRQ